MNHELWRKIIIFFTLFALPVIVFYYRYEATRPIYKVGDHVRISSNISEEPVIEGLNQKIRLEGVQAYLPRYPEYDYGDYLILEGIAEKGRSGYYLSEAVVVGFCNNTEPYKNSNQLCKSKFINNLRQKILKTYSQLLPEPHAALLSGIVLGTKNSLDNTFLNKLKNTGTVHIIVASGTNIAIFAGAILYFLLNILRVHRKTAILIASIFIWTYILFIGFQPPIVRAGVMASVAFIAQILGKESDSLRALVVSAVLMLLAVPEWLFDIGFQLSFLATLGIILFGNRLAFRLGKLKLFQNTGKVIKDTLAMTLSAQILVLPLIYHIFGTFPLISPIVNILVVPVVPFIMAAGFVLGTVGLIFLPLAKYISWFIWLPLQYFVFIVDIFS